MKNIYYVIIMMGVLMGISLEASAVKAYPKPITYTQPDGTTVTIQLHGDEFLHWSTVGGRLVQRGEDGYVYYASFNADGSITRSNSRAGIGLILRNSASSVTPPPAAIQRALEKREQMRLSVRRMVSSAISRTGGSPDNRISIGNKRFLVVLAQFSDLSFTVDSPITAFTNLLNQEGYSANGGTGSAKDYYEDNSTDVFQPVFDVKGPVTVSHPCAYYGGNDSHGDDLRTREFISEACTILNNTDPSVNFADYDLDNDEGQTVDNVFVYYPGHNEAEGGGVNTIWPHRWSVADKEIILDGKRIYSYACTSEYSGASGTNMCGIGTFCHEFGHTLGLPDFYDTDYETNGSGSGLGVYSLMSSGNYNNDGKTPPYLNAEERKILGWMGDPPEIVSTSNISAISIDNNVAYKINTNNPGEYFLFEARKAEGWDKPLVSGLLIYHVDKSLNSVGTSTAKRLWDWLSKINAYGDHQCMDLVETVPESEVRYINDLIFPGIDKSHPDFTSSTTPVFKGWNGESCGYSITGIAVTSTGASFTVTKDGGGGGGDPEDGTIFHTKGYARIDSDRSSYSPGSFFHFKIIEGSQSPSSITWTYDGISRNNGSYIRILTGEHTVIATLTYSDGRIETIEKVIVVE